MLGWLRCMECLLHEHSGFLEKDLIFEYKYEIKANNGALLGEFKRKVFKKGRRHKWCWVSLFGGCRHILIEGWVIWKYLFGKEKKIEKDLCILWNWLVDMWINIKKLRHVHCWRNWRNVEWWGPTDESNFDCYKFFWKRGAAQVMYRRPVLGEVDISWLKDDDYLEMLNDEVLQMSRILTVISFSEKGGRLKWCIEGLFWGKLIYPDWRMMIILKWWMMRSYRWVEFWLL